MPDKTFIGRQVWTAAALQTGCRPRLPVGFAAHAMSGSNHTVSDPRRLSALLHARRFLVLQVEMCGLLIPHSDHAGVTR